MAVLHPENHTLDGGWTLPTTLEWTKSAVCASTDPESFFPDKGESVETPKRTCSRCPVRGDCLNYAMGRETVAVTGRHGVWGGLSAHERHALGRTGWLPGDPTPPVRLRYTKDAA